MLVPSLIESDAALHKPASNPGQDKENDKMSHMVIYRGTDGKPGYHQTDDIHDAVTFVEQLRNDQGVEHARIFRLEEVSFEYRPYFRVELRAGDSALGAAATPAAVGAAPATASAASSTPAAAAPSASAPSAGATAASAPAAAAPAASPVAAPAADAAAASSASAADAAKEKSAEAGSAAEAAAEKAAPPASTPASAEKSNDGDNGVGARRGLFGR